MKELHNIYNLHVDDVRYRGKLKTRDMKDFKDQIEFLRTSNNITEIVISRATALDEIDFRAFSNDEECIVAAAKVLRNEILEYSETLPSFKVC